MRRARTSIRCVALLAAVGVVAACSGSDDGGADDSSIVDMLDELPAEVGDGDDPVQIAYGNLQAATELAGLERPTSADDVDAVLDWLMPLTGLSNDDHPALVHVAMPMAANSERAQQIDEFAAETGWSLVNVDSYIEYQRPPDLFTAINGSTRSADLDQAAGPADDGVWSVGDGDDYASNLDDVSAARPFGAPLRMGMDDDELAVSRSTPALRAWLADEGPTMADNAPLFALAEQLDAGTVYSAYLFSADPTRDTENPFDAMGAGLSVDDGEPQAWFVYHYADDATAEAAVATVRGILDGSSERTRAPWSDIFSDWEVTAVDDVVVAELHFVEGRPPGVVWQILFSQDTLAPL
jgi:hypothetical protein